MTDRPSPMREQTPQKPTSAEDYARRWYRQDHFGTKEGAERAYFRVLSEWLVRGQRIASLSRKLGASRKRRIALSARCTALTDINAGLVKDHNYLLIDGAKWQTRAETAEARCTALEAEKTQLDILLSQASQAAMLNNRAYLEEHDKCTALEQERDQQHKKYEDELEHIRRGGHTIWSNRAKQAESRCQHLEQERDQLRAHIVNCVDHPTGDHQWACVTCVDTSSEALASRCQHLEQAVKGYLTDLQTIRDGALNVAEGDNAEDLRTFWRGKVIAYDVVLEGLPKRLAALASLLPSQDETPRTDENRVSFAAGYSTALDDVLKDRNL